MIGSKTYRIAIEETVVGEFEIAASTAEEAMTIAEEEYKKGAFVLAPGEVSFKQMAIIKPTKAATEWVEF